jgi:CheY-like chemotaxis protein
MLKVLVVDDALFFRKMLPKKLLSKGFIFDTAENGLKPWRNYMRFRMLS